MIVFILIAIVGLEALYYYKIYKISPHKITSKIHHSQEIQEAFWVSLGNKEEMKLEYFSATEFLLRFIVAVNFYDGSEFKTALPVGASLADLTSRQIRFSSRHELFSGHLSSIVISIWVSRNYTSEEAINYVLDNMFLGHNIFGVTQASGYYFSKELHDLNYSEVLTLVALSHAPSYYNPDCNKIRLLERAKLIDTWLKKINPMSYSNSTYKFPEINVNTQVKCK